MKVKNKSGDIVSVTSKSLYRNKDDNWIGIVTANRHIVVNDLCNDWSTETTPEFVETGLTYVINMAVQFNIPTIYYYFPQLAIDLFAYLYVHGVCTSGMCQDEYFIIATMLTVIAPLAVSVILPLTVGIRVINKKF